MSKIIAFAKTIRRNWKKSTLFFGVIVYGSSVLVERRRAFQMMRTYCEEAKPYGEQPLPQLTKVRHVTVILNPEANNNKAHIEFEKFAAPLFHLAGYKVSMFQTENPKQAQALMEIMTNTDAVIIAGGNGTVHEAITGLMRRPKREGEQLPLGIIPVGKTNTVAKHLFGSKSSLNGQMMAEAAMAVIRGKTTNLDIMKIQFANDEKPVYAACSVEQGVFADLEPKIEKYWYFGVLKDRFTYFMHAFKSKKPIKHEHMWYVAPCSGCSRCFVAPTPKDKSETGGRWWSAFVPRKRDLTDFNSTPDYSGIINEECGKCIELQASYSNISLSTLSADQRKRDHGGPLVIKIHPKNLSFTQFITSGLRHQKYKLEDPTGICKIVEARELNIETTSKNSTKAAVLEKPDSSAEEATLKTASTEETISKTFTGEDTSKTFTEAATIKTSTEEVTPENSTKDATLENSAKDNTSKNAESKVSMEQCFYIDNEKYEKASCSISLMPKQVTVFG